MVVEDDPELTADDYVCEWEHTTSSIDGLLDYHELEPNEDRL